MGFGCRREAPTSVSSSTPGARGSLRLVPLLFHSLGKEREILIHCHSFHKIRTGFGSRETPNKRTETNVDRVRLSS